MPPSPSHQLRLLPAWLLDLIFVLPGLYIMLSNTVRAQMPLPLLPQQSHLLRKSIDYCNIVSVTTNVSKDTFHLPLIYSIGVTIHGTPWDDILYERSHMCALISQRAFVDATFLRKWLPCCFPFCRYGAVNWPYHKLIYMRYAVSGRCYRSGLLCRSWWRQWYWWDCSSSGGSNRCAAAASAAGLSLVACHIHF